MGRHPTSLVMANGLGPFGDGGVLVNAMESGALRNCRLSKTNKTNLILYKTRVLILITIVCTIQVGEAIPNRLTHYVSLNS